MKLIKANLDESFGSVKLLKYQKNGRFEDFLALHAKNNKLYSSYCKTDKDIYRKTMGENGKNLQVLQGNIRKYKKCRDFLEIFKVRKVEME